MKRRSANDIDDIESLAPGWTRRDCFRAISASVIAASSSVLGSVTRAQVPGERPAREVGLSVLNPRGRVPVSLIVDDSTCLVNLNRFAMPQFDEAFGGVNDDYHRDWQKWPAEIPDSFVRKFAEWAIETGVKGKYSIVPYPACVGRVDRMLPGWSLRALDQSLELVRARMLTNWDIHPEMVTHTRVIDVATGHPYPEVSLKTMENWDWTTGKSVAELTEYLAYALRILKNVDLPCEGVTTPGGFGVRARPQLAEATLLSVRDTFGAEIPHYFRDLYDDGEQSVAPRVELASGLCGSDPRCVVSIIGCTGDWTGGWDCSLPVGTDRFISADLHRGRMVDVIERGEPAVMVCHWTGIYFNGEELGLQILSEVVRRLEQRFDHLIWMKLSEIARYWAAKELTHVSAVENGYRFQAPFACPQFTIQTASQPGRMPRIVVAGAPTALRQVDSARRLEPGTYCQQHNQWQACFALPRGESQFEAATA